MVPGLPLYFFNRGPKGPLAPLNGARWAPSNDSMRAQGPLHLRDWGPNGAPLGEPLRALGTSGFLRGAVQQISVYQI
jgi:hypothetical protein